MALDVNFEGPGRQIMAPDFYLCLTNVINIHFFDFLGPGRRRMALNSYFEGPGVFTVLQFRTLEITGSSVLDFGEEGSSVLDFGDDRFFSFGLWRRWVLQFLDLVFQSVYPQFVSWTPNLSDSHFEGTGIQLESQFESPQLSLKEFQKKVPGKNFEESSLDRTSKVHDFLDKNFFCWSSVGAWASVGVGSSAGAGAGAGARAGGDFLDENFEGLRLLRGLRLLG
ncbi:hypothetical protein GLOIN_2v1790244 [Rhizophagus irregularis DAOM 181602=DAOM 197198]|uniref:Uncharacterized protein n=1 Tax=Rhizophagus irregularis (strain DAOM 181602 / DAOM 197198 / MUCL 43194) TaxID=747089 RepID=A0A2P4NZK1_RHIID|nr:hypothetical protein GLOIN_2v1790244 [Rhizophagus irregularis DAOM 181602=DAOM 197198]POG58566.1 hypothetical protein GLOIN_2v1790244 [Rhizophagus irregularis DAOM 181602=DAOM 197198]|eukprot:XP_025165432.1 hypothetical protein GLOIN_2v1790244 [Rhizophagus irregularis DAOM 181602=DAOM 197198]